MNVFTRYMYMEIKHRVWSDHRLKELSHGILSYFGHVQNYFRIEGNMKIAVY